MNRSRRVWLQGALASTALLPFGAAARAQSARTSFPQWVASFRAKAMARGISARTYDSVMGTLKPDTSVYALQRAQPEFQEQTWQYLNRRVSDWRITTGREVAKQHASLLARVEHTYGVDRYVRWPGASRGGAPTGKKNC
jgi:membrane-bound lytic murein transglycosylase B